MIIEDPTGAELCKIHEKMLLLRDTMEIERVGEAVATVKEAMITPLRERFSVGVRHGDDLEAHGNIVDHEYRIERGGDKNRRGVQALVPRARHLRRRGRPGQDDALILASPPASTA